MLGSRLMHISSMNFLARLFRGFIFVFIALYLTDIGFNGFQVGFLLSILAITSLFISLPVGIINDRLDIRYTILLGYALVSVFLLCLGSLQGFLLFIPIFLLGGMGLNIIETSFRSYIFKDREPWHEGRKYGIFNLSDVLSFSLGVFAGMYMVSLLGFPFTFIFIGFYHLALIPLLSFLEPIDVVKARLVQYERDFLKPNNMLLAIILFIFASHWGAETTSYSLFLREVLGLGSIGMGIYTGIAIIPLGLAAYVFGKRIDKRTDFHRLLLFGLIVSGISHILVTIPEVYASLFFRLIHEAGDGIAGVAILFWLGRKFKRVRLGGDSGIFFLVMTLGGFAGSIIYGPIGFQYGYSWPLIISGITSLICAGLFVVLKRRLD